MNKYMIKHPLKVILALLLVLPMLALAEESKEPQSLTFGVVPQQSATKLARIWIPILNYLGEKTGLDIRLGTGPNIPEFELRVAAGQYDVAYMNPYHYTVFSKHPGYRAFAKAKGRRIKGIFVVLKESSVNGLGELDGSTLAFPAPAAFAASILTRSQLAGEGINITPEYVSSHDSVYRAVAKGLYPAGGGVPRTFNALDQSVRDQLRILWTSDGFTPHAFAAHPRVPADTIERLQKAMILMEQDTEGVILLESLKTQGFESASDDDWDDVRALKIDLLEDLGKPVL